MTARKPIKPAETNLGFEIGTRCRLSELGRERSPKLAFKIGTVLKKARTKNQIHLLFDGNKTQITLHRTYVEQIPEEELLSLPMQTGDGATAQMA